MDEDIRWVRLTLKGDRNAFRQIVEKYQHFVFTIAVRVVRNREDAEEIAQDVFLKVYRMLESFEHKSKFSTWLYTITYRTAIDMARKRQLPIDSIDEGDRFGQIADENGANPMENMHQKELSAGIREAIQQLKPLDGTLITLFYLHEKPVKEIAEITGLTETNIKTKLHRLREALREMLSRQLQEEISNLL